MVETLVMGADERTAALPARTITEGELRRPPVGDIHPYMQALDAAEAGREERIRLGDIRTAERPPLQVVIDGA